MWDEKFPEGDDLERFRNYLRLLARMQLDARPTGELDPSDLVQETLLEAYQRREQFRGKGDADEAAWLRAILARNVADALRAQGRLKRDVSRERRWKRNSRFVVGPARGLAGRRGPDAQRACTTARTGHSTGRCAGNRLPVNQREALILHYWQGCHPCRGGRAVSSGRQRRGRTAQAGPEAPPRAARCPEWFTSGASMSKTRSPANPARRSTSRGSIRPSPTISRRSRPAARPTAVGSSLYPDFAKDLGLVLRRRRPGQEFGRIDDAARLATTMAARSAWSRGTDVRRRTRESAAKFGDFELIEEIAQSAGWAVVFKARQKRPSRVVALKTIRPSGLRPGADAVQRFRIEAEAVARLDHPNIVPIYEMGEIRGFPSSASS